MNKTGIHTIDLHFQGREHAIAAYLIPNGEKAILIECGPATTIPALETGLKQHGYGLKKVSDLFLTHIHLDHAGAAGWLAGNGTLVHVHPIGRPHMINPDALLASARRIYGETLEELYGEIRPVPEDSVRSIGDGETIVLGDKSISAFSSPGHASHHHSYVYERVCFTGDVGGVRLPGKPNLTLPMPPPEFRLDMWRESLELLRSLQISAVAPTHFGIYGDVNWHLTGIEQFLDEVENWLIAEMGPQMTQEEVREKYTQWFRETAGEHGLDSSQTDLVEIINPSFMSGDGLFRFWNKYLK